MVFEYYHRLGKKQKAIYRKSDSIETIILNQPEKLELGQNHRQDANGPV